MGLSRKLARAISRVLARRLDNDSGDSTPGGATSVLTDDNGTVGLLDDDASTFLTDD